MGALILPGVQIGDGCVIGAGSVVTRDIEAYSRRRRQPGEAPIRSQR